jgi:hypothetical protein
VIPQIQPFNDFCYILLTFNLSKNLVQRCMNYKTLLTLTLVAAMSGCVSDSPALDNKQDKLSWLKNADAKEDAELALSKGDFRLLAMPLRHTVIPGIDVQQSRNYALRCGVRMVEGITDAVRGEEHLEQMKIAQQYAEDYNAIIKSHCKL